jgi:hypothetical protein
MLANYSKCFWYATKLKRRPFDDAHEFAAWYVTKYPSRPTGNLAFVWGWYMVHLYGDPRTRSEARTVAENYYEELTPRRPIVDSRDPILNFENWQEEQTVCLLPVKPRKAQVHPKKAELTLDDLPPAHVDPAKQARLDALSVAASDKQITLLRLQGRTFNYIAKAAGVSAVKARYVAKRTIALLG